MDTNIENLVKQVMNCAIAVRRYLGEGFIESVYREALLIELNQIGIPATKECSLKVYYKDGSVLGDFRVDVLVDERLILELKAVKELCDRHEIQLVNYLKASRIDDGLLINFGGEKITFKRKYRVYRPKGSAY